MSAQVSQVPDPKMVSEKAHPKQRSKHRPFWSPTRGIGPPKDPNVHLIIRTIITRSSQKKRPNFSRNPGRTKSQISRDILFPCQRTSTEHLSMHLCNLSMFLCNLPRCGSLPLWCPLPLPTLQVLNGTRRSIKRRSNRGSFTTLLFY